MNDLRTSLAGGASVLMPGAWDALSARLAADAGFSTVFLSGYCVSGTQLGLPDYGFLTQTEMADQARKVIAANPGLGVVVDGDTGYGNALNVIRTIELWEQAGAAGLFIEDQVWPKRCGHLGGKQVVPAGEWLAKIRAAVDHRRELFVCARTDARAAVGLDEAIERAKRAVDTGADAVFVEAPETTEEMERIAADVPAPVLVANMVEAGKTPLLTPDELTELGFRLVVSPLSALFSMVAAVRTSLELLASAGSLRDDLDRLVSFDEFTEIVGLPAVTATEERYRT
ncbi:MAG: oxaloacetate decarboxylase [Acidimicrobiales bacterium]|nr:oxaloacetate decarboxylase [Acidimicrobiales bacterium]